MALSTEEAKELKGISKSVIRIETMLDVSNVHTHEKRISRLEWTWGAILGVGGILGTLGLGALGHVLNWFKH